MVEAPHRIIEDFCRALPKQGRERADPSEIGHEYLPAPHSIGDLPSGRGAVYVFTLSGSSEAPAGPHRALKVGKAGPNSNSRFRTQHYNSRSAPSTLAGAIENNPFLHEFIGVDSLTVDIGDWIRKCIDRDHFFAKENRQTLLSLLEVYMKARLGPVFEGSLSNSISKRSTIS